MFLLGLIHAGGEDGLRPRGALAISVDDAENRHEVRPVGPRVQNRMELPIELSPCADVVRVFKLTHVSAQDLIRISEIFFREVGDRKLQQLRLQQSTYGEKLLDIVR